MVPAVRIETEEGIDNLTEILAAPGMGGPLPARQPQSPALSASSRSASAAGGSSPWLRATRAKRSTYPHRAPSSGGSHARGPRAPFDRFTRASVGALPRMERDRRLPGG